ncbi:hypothetical protein KBD61_03655 [Patescibacteria group bacterium]|nr:hypothetical protein [Patescibacteria group bacterium]MBP9710093.1 hypothetical protein [Patescibacteria group bacterium]
MAETIDEIARTNPKNAIRLRQLHNTFADLEQMKELLANEEDPKGPPPLPKRETSGAIRERLAERLGIILDHGEREANIIAIQNEIRDIGTAFVEVDKEIEPLEDRLAKTRIFKVHDQLEKEIKPLKERREKIKNRYDNAADRYNEAAIFPTAQEELEARLQMLRIARENDPKDRASVDGEINDLEHLKKLLPPPLPRREGAVLENKETGADRPKEMETLAESLGIILDPEKRQDHIDKLDDICGEIGEKIGKLDEEISRLQVKLEEVHDSEMRKDAIKALKLAEREKHQLKAKFDEAWEEEYQYRNRFPDASYEIRERIISLRADKEDDTNLNDKKLIDERIDALSRLRKLFDAEKEAKEQKGVGNLGLNYSYTPEAHIVDEKELADVVIPQEEDVDTTSWNKYVAPPGERGIPPRRLPGQTRESLIGRVDQIDAMIKTGRAADGTTMSSPIRQQLERGRAALARRLETMQTTSTEEENDNGRISGTREAFLPFRTSGSLDSKTLEEDQLITEHEVAKTERAQTREANAQVYKMRAQEYKKDLRTIVKALAQQGETVEIPGEPGVIAEPEKKSWISSVWTKIKNRREIATLKQQYETALERYEEAEQQRTAVERDIPVFEKARIAGRQGGFAESSKTLDKRFNEKSRFEQAVDTLKRVRDQGREVSNYLLTGKSPDGQTLTDKDKNNLRKEFIKEVLAVQKQITPEDSQLLEKAMEEVDEIYYPVTKLESSNIGLLQKFELTPEDRKGIEDIKDASLRQLKTLEAKASAGKTREEREQAQADLRGIKRDLGGKTVKEIHANLVHSVEAAMQLRALEMEPVSKKRLVHNYRERLRSIEQNLDLKDEVKVTLKNIQADLARAA